MLHSCKSQVAPRPGESAPVIHLGVVNAALTVPAQLGESKSR